MRYSVTNIGLELGWHWRYNGEQIDMGHEVDFSHLVTHFTKILSHDQYYKRKPMKFLSYTHLLTQWIFSTGNKALFTILRRVGRGVQPQGPLQSWPASKELLFLPLLDSWYPSHSSRPTALCQSCILSILNFNSAIMRKCFWWIPTHLICPLQKWITKEPSQKVSCSLRLHKETVAGCEKYSS